MNRTELSNRPSAGKTPGRIFAKLIGTAAVVLTCGGLQAEAAEQAKDTGRLLLRFDDRNFAAWEQAIPLFEKYGAHATFFIFGPIDGQAISTMQKLKAAGHTLGAHGMGHRLAVDAIGKMGERGYIETEVRPQLVAAEKAGVPLRHFCYPCSERDAKSDELLLKHFDRLVGGGFWPDAKAGRIDRCDELYVPAGEVSGRRVWIGSSVGACAPTVTGELARVVHRLAERKETALFYTHNIVPTAPHAVNDISVGELEFLLKIAKEQGVRVCGLNDIAARETK